MRLRTVLFAGLVVLGLLFFPAKVQGYWYCPGVYNYNRPTCDWVPPSGLISGHYECGSRPAQTHCSVVDYGVSASCQGPGWTQYDANCQISPDGQTCQIIGGYDKVIDCGAATWVNPTPTTPPTPGGSPTPTPTTCSNHCSGGSCVADGTSPPDTCGCSGCDVRYFPPKIRPAALVFLDLNGNGIFDPTATNLEKIITTPGQSSSYDRVGGSPLTVNCGVETTYVTPIAGFSFSSNVSAMNNMCYYQANDQYQTDINDDPWSTCGGQRFGCNYSSDDYKNWSEIDQPHCGAGAHCGSHCADMGNECDPDGSGKSTVTMVGGVLYQMPGNFHNYLVNNAGSLWIGPYDGKDVSVSMTPASGYTVTSAKYYQWKSGSGVEEITVCGPGGTACSSINPYVVNFTNSYVAGMGDAFAPGQHFYAVAIWGVKPVPKNCSIAVPAGNFSAGVASSVNLTGSSSLGSSDIVRFWVEKQTGATMSNYSSIVPAATQYIGAYYYYQITSVAGNLGAGPYAKSFGLAIPAGKYYLHCDISQDPGKCSGNPFCDYNGGAIACSGWVACVGQDTVSVCSEGGPYYGAWSACSGVTHTRNRSVTYDCAVATTQTESCTGWISGTFFDASELSTCPADPQTLPANLKIIGGTTDIRSATYQYGQVYTGADGMYNGSNIPSPDTYNLTVNPGSAQFVTTPKFACQGSTATYTTQGESLKRDFGFWKVYGGWFQGVGGDVYGGAGISDNIPGGVPAAQRYLILRDANSQDGLVYHKSGTIDLGTFPGLTVSVSGWNATSGFSGDRQDYGYWVSKMGIYAKTAWGGSGKPAYAPGTNGFQIYTYSGTATINFSPAVGEKMIFLINGDVNVTGNVTVPKTPGSPSFLAVIAKGTINFDKAMASAQGLWVGNAINVQSWNNGADSQFLGEGSFVGWNSVVLSRDRGALNNSGPAEKFTFRPDLIINAPEPMELSDTVFRLETP